MPMVDLVIIHVERSMTEVTVEPLPMVKLVRIMKARNVKKIVHASNVDRYTFYKGFMSLVSKRAQLDRWQRSRKRVPIWLMGL